MYLWTMIPSSVPDAKNLLNILLLSHYCFVYPAACGEEVVGIPNPENKKDVQDNGSGKVVLFVIPLLSYNTKNVVESMFISQLLRRNYILVHVKTC